VRAVIRPGIPSRALQPAWDELVDALNRPRLARFVDAARRESMLELLRSLCVRFEPRQRITDWKPVWHILSDGEFTLILANAAHAKNVPGRKTDVADAQWLAELLAHGLIRASFVPEAPTQEMRALLRTRKQLVREQASHVQRIQKTLEDANLKLASMLTNVIGVSGRAILRALIDGERGPEALLTLVQRGVKAPPERIVAALTGRVTDRHRFLLRLHLRQIDALDEAVTNIDREVNRELALSVTRSGCCAPSPASAI
jgi:transposase